MAACLMHLVIAARALIGNFASGRHSTQSEGVGHLAAPIGDPPSALRFELARNCGARNDDSCPAVQGPRVVFSFLFTAAVAILG